MTGALLSWGCQGASEKDLLRLVRRHRVTRVVDVRPAGHKHPRFGRARMMGLLVKDSGVAYERKPEAPDLDWIGRLYTSCREGRRVLLLDVSTDPAGTARAELLQAIAREAALYARSAMSRVIQPIEVGHLVGDKLMPVTA